MNSKSIIGAVLCLGVAFALLSGAGAGAMFGESPGDEPTVDTVGEIGEEASVDAEDEGGISADVTGDDEPTLVGLAISGGAFLVNLVAAVGLLPMTLVRLGFPDWFAFPVGFIAQAIALIGLVQFVRTGDFQ